jgi:poly-gamma-glutamate system protein
MKRLYWRPQKCSRTALLIVALLAMAGMLAVQVLQVRDHTPLAKEKLAAAKLAGICFDVIRQERAARGYSIDPETDPTGSGVVGLTKSPVTSIAGHLESKQTSINPNFAAAVVQMLRDAGVERGDQIAIGCSGSFPALNTAVCAACEAMQVRPIIIASAAASQYGANYPDLLWVDMERILNERGLISFRAQAASVGGYEDRGLGMSSEGRELIHSAIERNGLTCLDSEDFVEAIDQRLAIYERVADGRPIQAYINIGGGSVSVGRALGKKLYRPGLNVEPPPGATEIDSVMTRFAETGVPVIHLVEIRDLARQYELPETPAVTPPPGDGTLFGRRHPSRWLAAIVLAGLLLALRCVVLTDWGHRLSSRLRDWTGRPAPAGREPEWMV